MKRLAVILLLLGLLVGVPIAALAQNNAADGEKSFFLKFVQDRLSTPERQISISNIDGALSSTASIREVDVSDEKGVYLQIKDIALDWNQAAIFAGRLEINSLTAASIDYLRNPVPAADSGRPGLPSPEAAGLSIPSLPVAAIVKKLAVPRISFGEELFGLGSSISLTGNVALDGGSLDAGLAIKRLDGPGGSLDLSAKYAKDSTQLDLNLGIDEPKGGILATLLNIEDRPDVHLAIRGSGPLADLKTQLDFAAAGQSVLAGEADVRQEETGFAVSAQLGGPIASILPSAYRGFFGGTSTLEANALLRSDGGLTIDRFTVAGGQLHLTGSASTSKDWFLDRLTLAGDIGSADGSPVLLPVSGASTRLAGGHLGVTFGGGQPSWQASLTGTGFSNGQVSAQQLTISGSGAAVDLDDPARRRLTFNVDGSLDGVASSDPALSAALGNSIGLGAAGLWSAGQPLQLAQFRLAGQAMTIDTVGSIDKGAFNGTLSVAAADIAAFAGIAGRPLAGGIDLKAQGSISPLSGGFDLNVDGTGSDLAIGDAVADRLLKGTVRLTGGIARGADGVTTRQLRIGNAEAQFSADGRFASDAANFRFDLGLADLALLDPRATGALTATGTAQGTGGNIAVALTTSIPNGKLLGRELSAATFAFNGHLAQGALTGTAQGSGRLAAQPIQLAADISSSGGGSELRHLQIRAGGTTLTGDLDRTSQGLLEGSVVLDASDISTVAALGLVEATGAANADVAFTAPGGRQSVSLDASARSVVLGGTRISAADVKAGIADLFGVPMVNGSLEAQGVAAGGVTIKTLSSQAHWDGQKTGFSLSGALAGGTQLSASGALAPLGNGYRLAINSASLTQGRQLAKLAAPAALTVANGQVGLDDVRLDIGGGRVTASGAAGKVLDVSATLGAVPLSVANAIAPGLGLSGTLDGTVHVAGSAAAPQAAFTISGRGIGAASTAGLGITPLAVSARGTFGNGAVQLAQMTASSPAGLSLRAKGSLPLSLSGLNIDAQGAVPLALADRFVASRGGQAAGTATFTGHIGGSVTSPKVAGQASLDGGSYVDPAASLKLAGISLRATFSGTAVTLDRLAAQVSTGGTISGTGKVSLSSGFDANIALDLAHVRYVDQPLLVTTVSGKLAMKGKLTGSPLLNGAIDVERAEISVPGQLGGGATALKVRHIDPPQPVVASLSRAAGEAGKSSPSAASTGGGPRLDLTIRAPNRVFVRGRGLDAELGGSLRLTGSLDNVQPVGAFDLIRGRLDILGQRLTFNSGSATLTGSLDPEIALAATVPSDDITAKVSVSGYASDPKIDFTSTPALAQDEVLSRLLFKQGVDKLSPLQLAKLAGAAASLAGGSGSSLLDDLRASTGLDDLDLTTDSSGNTAVKAGRYIDDNIYLGVQAGAQGKSRVTVNLDLAPGLKANAGTGTDGDSGVGVLYEQDY